MAETEKTDKNGPALRTRVIVAVNADGDLVDALVIKSESYASAIEFYGAINASAQGFKNRYPEALIYSGTSSSPGGLFWSHPEYRLGFVSKPDSK